MSPTPGIVADERDPLLPSGTNVTPSWSASESELTLETSCNDDVVQGATPLPLQQLSILGLIRLAEPINFTVIFPFVNQMMEELNVTDKPTEIGFYSGLVDSSFAVAQCCTILQWGRLSDRAGRRPVILVGLAGSVISIFLFGISKNLAWALTSRSIAGGLSGNIAVIQSVLAEITDSTNESKAMPLISVTWSLGTIIGPLIGGNLLHPAERWPNSPFNNAWFRKYPYSLPCSIGALFGFFALTIGYIQFGETLRRDRHPGGINKAAPTSNFLSPASPTELDAHSQLTGVWTILTHPPLRHVLLTGFGASFLATAYEVVFALICYTPIHLGGLSRSPVEIGYSFALSGIISVIILPTGMPYLQHRYGTIPLYQFVVSLWPVIFLGFPLLNVLARRFIRDAPSSASTGRGVALLWTGMTILIFTSRIASMSFGLNIMLVKTAAPDKRILGSTYGVSQTVACVARAVAPAFVGSLFALSVDKQLLHGNLVWYIMASIGLCCMFSAMRLTRRIQ